jgi:hypothetical protein
MFTRAISFGLILSAALGAVAAHAADRVAMLAAVEGTVLVSNKEGMAAGFKGQALAPGARVVATSKSRATIVYNDGCDVSIDENSRTTIRSGVPCSKLKSDVIRLAQASGAQGPTGPMGEPLADGGFFAGPGPAYVVIGGTSAKLGYHIVDDILHGSVSPH